MPWDDKKYIGVNTADNGVDTSSITSNPDGTVLERLEYVQGSLSGVIIADFIMSDMDDFDVADADADTVRWNPEYITGTEGGSADIDTTTSDCLMVKVDPDSSPTEARYAVSHSLPFYADFFTVTTDMATTWGTMGTTGCAAGIHLSKGSAYDNTNYLAIERVKSSTVNRITVSGKLNNVAISSTNASITDDALALKVSRYDDIWRFYYSLTPYPNEVWVLVAQVEDPSVYMTDQVTLYYEAYSKGSADAETIKADFGHFRYLVGSGGGGQYITGDYNSDWVTSNEDGNVMEREEYIQDATRYLYAVADTGTTTPTKVVDNSILSILMTKKSGGDTSDFDNSTDSLEAMSDKIGAWTGDGGTDYNDSIYANLIMLSKYIADGDGDMATGSVLPANKSLYNIIGSAYVDAGGTFGTDSVLSDLAEIHGDIEHLYALADGGTNAYPDSVVQESIFAYLMSKSANPVATSYNNTTDSLEALADAISDVHTDVADLHTDIADVDSDVAAVALVVADIHDVDIPDLHTDVGTVITDTEKIYDVTFGVSPVDGSLASFIATGGTALGTRLPASTSLYDTTKQLRVVAIDGTTPPVANTLSDILHKDGSYTYDNTTDSLEAISGAVAAIPTTTGVGTVQIVATTEDLNQAAASYDLLTGTTQPVLLEGLSVKMPTGAAGGALTSISIQTDDATPAVLVSSSLGAVANLTSEAEIWWSGIARINVGTKIQLTIAGGAHGSEYLATITAKYRSIVAGGTLAA